MKAIKINEAFSEDTDSVKDMGIGARPGIILQKFADDFKKAFNLQLYYDEGGSHYDLKSTDVYIVGEESFVGHDSHPVVKLLIGHKHELDFAMNNHAAQLLVKGSTWGWFYYSASAAGSKVHHLKDAYELDDVFRAIIKINGIQPKGFDNAIKRFEMYIKALNKMKKFINES